MINSVNLTGRLTADPNLRYTPNGVAVANFTVAVNKPTNNNNEADFIQVVAWRKVAENTANFMKKGSLIGVTGRLQTRTFQGNDNKTNFVTEVNAEHVAFLESKNK